MGSICGKARSQEGAPLLPLPQPPARQAVTGGMPQQKTSLVEVAAPECKDRPSIAASGKPAWDGDGVPLKDSNVAGIGSEEDMAVRKGAAQAEPAWQGVGLQPGLWIWRIESFQVKVWPKKKYGVFHEGDSYIILHAQKKVDELGKQMEALERDIFFWLGRTTSTDEKGTAAYKTVELDDFFDGEPTQHREVQGKESEEFHALFKEGLSYLAGGVDSGFNVVQKDIFTTKLYQVRRNHRRQIVVEEEAVRRETLNHRDAFILDKGRKIFVWFGDSSNPFIRNACIMKAERMVAERDGESTLITEADEEFWGALGGEGAVTSAHEVGEEKTADFGEGILYNVQVNERRELTVTEVGRRDLKRSMLDPTGVMMLDTRSEIFMWLGKSASNVEKRQAMKTASNYLKMNERDVDQTPITVLKQGSGRKNKVWAATFSN